MDKPGRKSRLYLVSGRSPPWRFTAVEGSAHYHRKGVTMNRSRQGTGKGAERSARWWKPLLVGAIALIVLGLLVVSQGAQADEGDGRISPLIVPTVPVPNMDIGVVKQFGVGSQTFFAYDAPSAPGGVSTLLADDTGACGITRDENVVAMTSGALDATGEAQVAVVKQFGAKQYLYIYNLPPAPGGACTLRATETNDATKNVTKGNNVILIAAGDFDTTDAAEELAVIKTFGATQYLFIYNPPTTIGGAGTRFSSETPPGVRRITRGDNVAFMASGNFDADARHEVAVVKTFGVSQLLFIYDVPTTMGGSGTLIAYEGPPVPKRVTSGNSINSMTAGNFDADATDEIAVTKMFGVKQIFYVYDVPTTAPGSGAMVAFDVNVLPRNNNVAFMAGLQ